jgi:hypothetical protein
VLVLVLGASNLATDNWGAKTAGWVFNEKAALAIITNLIGWKMHRNKATKRATLPRICQLLICYRLLLCDIKQMPLVMKK